MQLKFKETEYEIMLEKQNDNQSIVINNEKIDFSSILIDTNIFSVFSDGTKTNVYVAEDDNRFYVNIDGNSITLDKVKAEEKSFGE